MNAKGEILILLVESSQEIQTGMKTTLRSSSVRIVSAQSIETAKKLFEKRNQNFDVIVVNSCVDNPRAANPDTLDLTKWIRDQGYTGIMVAWGPNADHRRQQLSAGCNTEMEQYCLPRYIERMFCTSCAVTTPPPPC